MALSNYDQMVFPKDKYEFWGKGIFGLEVYKNWLYIKTKKKMIKAKCFTNGTIGEINSTLSIQLDDLRIETLGCGGVLFFVVETGYKNNKTLRQWGGIACYAYEGDEYVGVSQKLVKDFISWCEESKPSWTPEGLEDFIKECGLTMDDEKKSESLAERTPLRDFDVSRAVKSIKKARRVNNGDRFFSENLGFPLSEVETEPSNADKPVLEKMVKGETNGNKSNDKC
jgi:hypothetical protein